MEAQSHGKSRNTRHVQAPGLPTEVRGPRKRIQLPSRHCHTSSLLTEGSCAFILKNSPGITLVFWNTKDNTSPLVCKSPMCKLFLFQLLLVWGFSSKTAFPQDKSLTF